MKIVVLNGSPRKKGNTAAMTAAFKEGAEGAGHSVEVLEVASMQIGGCKACDCCRKVDPDKRCVQDDDFSKMVRPALESAEMIVFASPVYHFTLSAQLQAALQRTYAMPKPGAVKRAALILSSGSDSVYDPSTEQYRRVIKWWGAEDAGIFTAHGEQNKSEAKLAELKAFGASL